MTSIKEKIKKYKNSNNLVLRTIYFLLLFPYRTFLFTTNNRIRSENISKLLNKEQNQVSTFTKENRYPVLFKIVKEYFEKEKIDFKDLKILSYGCSTGEEVKTLHNYLPNAKITGIDINTWCITQAKKKYKNQNFFFTNKFEDIQANKYDAIFALAVLQHTINRTAKDNSKAQKFLFEDFEKEIIKLDNLLKSNGLLIIDHTDFNFLNTKISENYNVLEIEENSIKRNRPYFNSDNIKISDIFVLDRVFIKK